MDSKGTIFIVEDQEETKIGAFSEMLKRDGFKVIIAENYEDADRILNELIRKNELDGIILDFSFPYSATNGKRVSVVNGKELPNGVELLKKYLYKINTQRVPLIINSTAVKEYREECLEGIDFDIDPFIINTETQSLVNMGNDIGPILNLFNERSKLRNTAMKIQADHSWKQKGKTGTVDRKGNYFYNRDGD